MHNTAVSSNTVLIDEKDHVAKKGEGIREGFTAQRFDYASGDSGNALPNGKHHRNFIFVHPQDGRNGYFLLVDEIKTINRMKSKVNVALHPNSAVYSIISDMKEYRWAINQFSGNDVFLTIFLGTQPKAVTLKNGALNTRNLGFVGKYLYTTYDTSSAGKRNIVTVVFPHNADHPKAAMARISGTDYSGAQINLGASIKDVALESSGASVITHGAVNFQAKTCVYRMSSENLNFYFIRKGRFFNIECLQSSFLMFFIEKIRIII